jgi:hypothetical protein
MLAIRAGGTGDVANSRLLWRINKGSQAATPLYYDGLLYCVDDRGIATCVTATDGKMLYQERLEIPGQGAKVYASLVMADDKLYAVTREGGTLVLAPGEKSKELARNDLGDTSIFMPRPPSGTESCCCAATASCIVSAIHRHCCAAAASVRSSTAAAAHGCDRILPLISLISSWLSKRFAYLTEDCPGSADGKNPHIKMANAHEVVFCYGLAEYPFGAR